MNASSTSQPEWMEQLRQGVHPAYLRIADDVWSNRADFIKWPVSPLLFMSGVTRVKYHRYDTVQKARLKAAQIAPDGRANGPAIMAFKLAGGNRPIRSLGREGWPIHHIYDGQFPAPGQLSTVRAVTHPELFTNAAGLVAVHPIADALADELAYFAWLLRHEAFVRFAFDPDNVFAKPPQHDST